MGQPGASNLWQTTRFLRIGNDTKEKVRVNVQYFTLDDAGQWVWGPSAPEQMGPPLAFELDPGEIVDIQDGDWRVNGQRVRIWADSDSRAWNQFKDADLWLVPERDGEDNAGYVAADVQTFNFNMR